MTDAQKKLTAVIAVLILAFLLIWIPRPAQAHNAQCPSEPLVHSADLVPLSHNTNFHCNPSGPDSFYCGPDSRVWLEMKSKGFGFTDSTGNYKLSVVNGQGNESIRLSSSHELDGRGWRWYTDFMHVQYVQGETLNVNLIGYHLLTIGCHSVSVPSGGVFTWFVW